MWLFLERLRRERRSFNLASALTIEFLIVVDGDEGRRDCCGDKATGGVTTKALRLAGQVKESVGCMK